MRRNVLGTDERTELSPRVSTPPAPPASDDFSISSGFIQESFQVWLQGMTGDVRRQHPARALTPGEIAAVSLATVREGCKHRRWPREIVERFLATEVVTSPLASSMSDRELKTVARRFNFLRIPGEGYATIASRLRR